MSQWKSLASPKLNVPLELREVTSPGGADRVFEVQELRTGAVFKVTLRHDTLHAERRAARISDAEAERAVCLSVEESLLQPPDKEPGVTYEVTVGGAELSEAVDTAG